MGKAIEYLEKSHVPKPVGKILLKDGEQIRKSIRKKLSFEPIRLKKKPAERHIKFLTQDLHNFAVFRKRQNEGTINIAELKTRLYDPT